MVEIPTAGATILNEIKVTGWAIDRTPAGIQPVDRLLVWLDDTSLEEATALPLAPTDLTLGLPRDDVPRALQDEAARPSGFLLNLRLPNVAPGPHQLALAVHGPSGWATATIPVNEATTVGPAAAGQPIGLEVTQPQPDPMPVPTGHEYPPLDAPSGEPGPHTPEAIALMQQVAQAMQTAQTMQERREGRLYLADGTVYNTYVYDVTYQAPDRMRQRSVITTAVDQAEQRIVQIGRDFWSWRGGDQWEHSLSLTPYAWPGRQYSFRGSFDGRLVEPDEIDGRTYLVLEYQQGGDPDPHSPQSLMRVRLWVDAETKRPFKRERAALQTLPTAVNTYDLLYREVTLDHDFDAPIEIRPPS